MREEILVKCDGACLPFNPGGTATYGFVVYKDGELYHEGCGIVCKGQGATNNVAEYWAVIHALEYLRKNYLVRSVRVQSDSQIIINQINGIYGVKASHLKALLSQIREHISHFEQIKFQWIEREFNEDADAMSRKAYYGR